MLTRREFLKVGATASGVAITIHYLPWMKLFKSGEGSAVNCDSSSWMGEPGKARHRYEGVAKVTGAKIYAKDFRVTDFQDWPQQEVRVALLKATRANQVFLGIKSEVFSEKNSPFQVVLAEDLGRFRIQCPSFFNTRLLVKKGECADYLGQGLALLYFQPDAFLSALPQLNNPDSLIDYGAVHPAKAQKIYCSKKFLKYKKNKTILFSAIQDGEIDFTQMNKNSRLHKKMQYYSGQILKDLKNENWTVLHQTYKTQSVDPGFMESENGLCWYNQRERALQIVSGSQSPYADAEYAAQSFSDPHCPIQIKSVDVQACYPGGGFGGKDHSIFAVYLALAAVFSDGKPIRMVNSRFDQFQFGLKRHAAEMKETLAIDRHGYFQWLKADLHFDGGGYDNFSWCVPKVAASNAASGSYFPRAEVSYQAKSSSAVPAGSMRGFGAMQSQFAIESLIDEAAERIQIDAVDLRLKNYFNFTQETIRGIVPNNEFQVKTILENVKKHPLWVNRAQFKRSSSSDALIGVGFAMAMKSFGTTRDAVLAEVMIEEDATISLVTNYLDMGNGVATTLPLACAEHLGSNASRIKLGAIQEFLRLELVSEFCTEQEQLNRAAKNPRFTPEIMMSTAASAGAYQHRHVVLQATKILFEQSIIPAAKILWGDVDIKIDQLQWSQTQLTHPGLPPLKFSRLVETLYKNNFIIATLVHGYYQASWAKGVFALENKKLTLPIDALALKRPGKEYQLLDRIHVEFPPVSNELGGEDIFTPCGALCKVRVHAKTGKVEVKEMHSFLDCGPVINQHIVEGQVHGGVAMGIGQTLLEHFPRYDQGPGSGGWNFHRYSFPRASDVPVFAQEVHLIDPFSINDHPKGIAEVVLNPIAPAIANAIAHATGKRFRELPILPKQVKEALL